MPEPQQSRRFDVLPVIVLCGLIGLLSIGYWLFPYFQKMIQHEDCVSVGRVDCG